MGLIRKYACFTLEQQAAFEGLNEGQRRYVEYRGQGYTKAQSWTMAGYASRNPSQAVQSAEKLNKTLKELAEILYKDNKARELTVEDSALNRQIDALALQKCTEETLAVIDGADGETARRIKFYRDIINGKIKTFKRTTTKDALGRVKSIKEEESDDVGTRISARKELDKILGLTMILPDVDRLQVGGITINIVDASKKEEEKAETETAEAFTVSEEEIVVEEGEEAREESK